MNILVTGASTGIGLSCAKFFAEKGECVIAGVRKPEDFKKFQNHPKIHPIILDVTNPIHIASAVEYIKRNQIKLDVLLNNAGIAVLGPLVELSESDLLHQFDVNVLGVFKITKALYPFLLESKGGIVNIGSTSGLHAYPFEGPYAMSKHAIEAFSDSLRRELMQFGVKVILIEPSKVKTEIWSKTEDTFKKFEHSSFREKAERLLKKSLNDNRKKGLEPEAVAREIYKILKHSNPKPRYLISKHKALSWITNAIPDRWLDSIIRKI